VIVDREGDLSEWVRLLKKVQERRIMILAFANNHYAGFGPGTADLFRRLRVMACQNLSFLHEWKSKARLSTRN
jgi:hypothetical protein